MAAMHGDPNWQKTWFGDSWDQSGVQQDQAGVVQQMWVTNDAVVTNDGVAFYPSNGAIEEARLQLAEIRALMATCVLCGQPGEKFFCEVCRYAVTETRRRLLQEMVEGFLEDMEA